jgi:hypothetical protein
MTAGEQDGGDMALLDSPAVPVLGAAESSRPRTRLERGASARVSSWLARRLDSLRDLWDGTSWEPGHDWLTRDAVPDIAGFWRPPPGGRREPR